MLDEASEGLTFDVLTGDDNPDENISIEKLTSTPKISTPSSASSTPRSSLLSSAAPPISTSRATTIPCIVKYRIDGVLQEAMAPIAREHHGTILAASRS